MVEFSALKVGDVLYSVWKERMGNTTMSRTAYRALIVKEVDAEKRRALLVGGPDGKSRRGERMLRPLRRTPPKVVGRI